MLPVTTLMEALPAHAMKATMEMVNYAHLLVRLYTSLHVIHVCDPLITTMVLTMLDGTDDCGNICDHICIDSVFGCACYHGYYLDADNVTCKGKASLCTLTLFSLSVVVWYPQH